MLRKLILILIIPIAFVFAIAIASFFLWGKKEMPPGREGDLAEQLTDKIQKAIRLDHWHNTVAISFIFDSGKRWHFRDNKRGHREVSWAQYKVQYNRQTGHYLAWKASTLLEGKEAHRAYKKAYELHTNDFFWLHPFSQLRAPGTKRFFVSSRALLLHYTAGGITPGDSYLIITNEKSLPIRWQVWAAIFPLQGFTFRFENWKTYSTGAYFSTMRRSPLLDVALTQIKTYSHYPLPGAKDRFLRLSQKIQTKTHH